MNWTVYWFMFPACIVISSIAMLSGISGAAMLSPTIILLFPLIGVPSLAPAAAIGMSLFTINSSRPTKILIPVGGFGSLEVARHLDHLFRFSEEVSARLAPQQKCGIHGRESWYVREYEAKLNGEARPWRKDQVAAPVPTRGRTNTGSNRGRSPTSRSDCGLTRSIWSEKAVLGLRWRTGFELNASFKG